LQINLWIPHGAGPRDLEREEQARRFLEQWGPPPPAEASEFSLPSFEQQCQTLLGLRPRAVSSIFGLFPAPYVAQLRAAGIAWFACVTSSQEALEAEAAGADAVVVQGMEAGGHRGVFDPAQAEQRLSGLFALLPRVADKVKVPVVATGGIADARGVAAALLLGASAVQIGSAFLRCPEASIHPVWQQALAGLEPEHTTLTRIYTGRLARAIRNSVTEAAGPHADYPVQRGLAAPLKAEAERSGDLSRLQAWAGQAAGLGREQPAEDWTRSTWAETLELLD
jgi:nitronate monooxygenase